jgi:alkylation response protein AidB-like acyl-CoA dehydrogenase
MSINQNRLTRLLEMTSKLANQFAEGAEQIDREGKFPYENFKLLKEAGYLALTIPKCYGGEEISLYELVVLQERLAHGDAATALAVGWHLSVVMELAIMRPWDEQIFAQVCRGIVEEKKLINRAASEAATGSPTRGGKPQTTAYKVDGGWELSGRKTFTTMSEALDYIVVSAAIEETDQVVYFLVHGGSPGVSFEHTWDTLGMRGTASHDLILDRVFVPEEGNLQEPARNGGKHKNAGWLLHIPACYMGIATAARNYALEYAATYSPNSSEGPIVNHPNTKRLIGQMELEWLTARSFLHAVAKRYDENRNDKQLVVELAAVKHVVTNHAISIVDQAMRIAGGQSLYRKHPLERHYRDVRAGLHNPPMDDMTIQLLANSAIQPYISE